MSKISIFVIRCDVGQEKCQALFEWILFEKKKKKKRLSKIRDKFMEKMR